MMISVTYIIGALCILSFLGFTLSSKYILQSLIYLESMMLGCMFFLIVACFDVSSVGLWLLVLLVFSACEAALGLTLMINFVRVNHSASFNSSTQLQ